MTDPIVKLHHPPPIPVRQTAHETGARELDALVWTMAEAATLVLGPYVERELESWRPNEEVQSVIRRWGRLWLERLGW